MRRHQKRRLKRALGQIALVMVAVVLGLATTIGLVTCSTDEGRRLTAPPADDVVPEEDRERVIVY